MAKISISLPDELLERVAAQAGSGGVSAYLAQAAERHLRSQILVEVADDIARQSGGPLTDAELQEAREWLQSSSTPERS